jgi:hypothetical protein
LTTKIHVLVDALGRPLSFILTGGEAHGSTTATTLLAGHTTAAVIANKAYDNNALRKLIADTGAVAVIPSLCSRKILIPPPPTSCATVSNASSTSSSIFAISQPATIDARSTSWPRSTLPAL